MARAGGLGRQGSPRPDRPALLRAPPATVLRVLVEAGRAGRGVTRMFSTGSRMELQLEIERLVAYEAYLLDERRFHEWLELFTDDATYGVSVREVVQRKEEGGGLYRYPETRLFDEDHGFTTVR